MAWLLIALVIAFPVVEIAVFVKVAGALGVLATVALALGAGLVGLILVRAQGLRALLRAKAQAEQGDMPMAELFDGVCLAVAGGLLILPGFITDALAVLLLLPPVRMLIKGWLARHFTVVGRAGTGPTVIDGEYEVVRQSETRIGRD